MKEMFFPSRTKSYFIFNFAFNKKPHYPFEMFMQQNQILEFQKMTGTQISVTNILVM